MVQFEANLKRTKMAIKKWIPVWKARTYREVLEIEKTSQGSSLMRMEVPLSLAQLEEIKILEERRNAWFRKDKHEWHPEKSCSMAASW
jgi:hypothetical protein